MYRSIRLGVVTLALGGLLALPSAAMAAGTGTGGNGGMGHAGQHHPSNTTTGASRSALGARTRHGSSTSRGASSGQAQPGGRFGPAGGFDLQAVATALKLTPQQLQQQLQAGKSIAQVAQAQSVALQTVHDAVIAATKTRLDQAVAAGRLTSAQESQRLSTLQANLDQRLNATGGFHRGQSARSTLATPATQPAAATSGS